jgi:ATP-dependent Lon protease
MRDARDDDLPVGYERVRLDSRASLVLPAAVARQSRLDLDRREVAKDEARRAELKLRQDDLKQKVSAESREDAAPASAKTEGFSKEAAPGWYRVLPGLQAMLDAGEDTDFALRAADKDVRERHASIRKRLLAQGPDRLIARPLAWRAAMAELEAALPNFREPIRLLRNTLALAEFTLGPVRVPPILLLGSPGVGKTLFSHRVAELMGAAHASIAFDQPMAGSDLRGVEKMWSTSETGLLFNLICLDGRCANPVVLLDEIDKSSVGSGSRPLDPLAQLHGALEPQSARRTTDVSVGIEFDASLVTYIATANSLRGLTQPILSRMEVFSILPPEPSQAVEIARNVVRQVLERLHLGDRLRFDRKCLYLLAHLSPRLMLRTVEMAAAAAIEAGQAEVREADLWAELGPVDDAPRLH